MKEEISVLIADDNVEFGNILTDYMSLEDDIRVVGQARDGVEAIEMIKLLKPDMVILDVIMPNLDGIGVLEKIATMELVRKPLFVMLSAIGQDVFIQKAVELGAEYYMVKPFDVGVLVSRIRQIYKEKRISSFGVSAGMRKPSMPIVKNTSGNFDLEVEVTNLMRDVGIPPHMSGYQYIREAIMQTISNSKMFRSVTKFLYPSVAEKFGTTPQKVERAIRNAIEGAWARGNTDSIDSLFGYTINYNKGKPTNSEFIAMMADKIRVSLGSDRRFDGRE